MGPTSDRWDWLVYLNLSGHPSTFCTMYYDVLTNYDVNNGPVCLNLDGIYYHNFHGVSRSSCLNDVDWFTYSCTLRLCIFPSTNYGLCNLIWLNEAWIYSTCKYRCISEAFLTKYASVIVSDQLQPLYLFCLFQKLLHDRFFKISFSVFVSLGVIWRYCSSHFWICSARIIGKSAYSDCIENKSFLVLCFIFRWQRRWSILCKSSKFIVLVLRHFVWLDVCVDRQGNSSIWSARKPGKCC